MLNVFKVVILENIAAMGIIDWHIHTQLWNATVDRFYNYKTSYKCSNK